jgi:hypothetical protein
MHAILLATAGLSEEGIGDMLRAYILCLPFIPESLLQDFSFQISGWAFIQIPTIAGVVWLSSWRIRKTRTTSSTRLLTLFFVYAAATLTTNLLLGALDA